jgi:hypothetical protein
MFYMLIVAVTVLWRNTFVKKQTFFCGIGRWIQSLELARQMLYQ